MVELSEQFVTRWASSNGDLTVACDGDSTVQFKCGNSEVKATLEKGFAKICREDALKLMPEVGIYLFEIDGREFLCERVGSRYTSRDLLLAYGKNSADTFDNEDTFPPNMIDQAIQRAEEAIERACGRSFCTRKTRTFLFPGDLCELPVVDVREIIAPEGICLVSDRQVTGVKAQTWIEIIYGAMANAQISEATTRLAASYLRPRVGAENARGTSQDGVYISYDLATGSDGSWTGIPYVDAAIEQNKSRRVIIA